MDLFSLKKMIGALLMPTSIISLLLLLGLIFLYINRHTAAKVFLTVGVALLLTLSLPWFPYAMLKNYERQYPQFDMSANIDAIVVLGCNHANDAALPITAQLSPCSSIRMLEALRIQTQHPDAIIYVSGANGRGEAYTNAEMYQRMLVQLGVDETKIKLQRTPRDTAEEAKALAKTLGNSPFALVTSASHMPRAMTLFTSANTHPIAAPTNHLVKDYASGLPFPLPTSQNLTKSTRWWYETLGQYWVKIVSWWQAE